jgi:hypothetical protein
MVQGMSGVCVQLGCGDAVFTAKLAERGRLLVHVLEADDAKVEAARAVWQARGLYGQLSVEVWGAAQLPYTDNLVNVLVVEDPGRVPEGELRRVLAPGGTAWVRRAGDWLAWGKGWPKEFDEWTHGRHGADGNMVSHDLTVAVPSGLRWVAGPVQDAGGKRWYYDHALVSARGRNFYAGEEGICARDAFNGALLWRRQMKLDSFRETGTPIPSFLEGKARLGARQSRVWPAAAGDRLYLAAGGSLLALDGATGQTAEVYGGVTSPRELLVEGNALVVSDGEGVRAYDVTSRERLWAAAIPAERIVAGDGRMFCLSWLSAWQTVKHSGGPTTQQRFRPPPVPIRTAFSFWKSRPGGTIPKGVASWFIPARPARCFGGGITGRT